MKLKFTALSFGECREIPLIGKTMESCVILSTVVKFVRPKVR
jgi:hypothetical protein